MSNTPPKGSEDISRRKYHFRNLACRHSAFKKRNWKPIWKDLGVLICWNGLPKNIPTEQLERAKPEKDGTEVFFDKTRLYGAVALKPDNGLLHILVDPSQPTRRIWVAIRKEISNARGLKKKPQSVPHADVRMERMFRAYDLRQAGYGYKDIARIVCRSPRHFSQVKDWCNRIEEELS
jgi:hypothetical protein